MARQKTWLHWSQKQAARSGAFRKLAPLEPKTVVAMRQNKYLNNMVEQDHRGVKRITQPMLGFKSFWSARITIAGIETMHMIKKGQMNCPDGQTMSAANQFYSLAA
jgi:transposase-like protein